MIYCDAPKETILVICGKKGDSVPILVINRVYSKIIGMKLYQVPFAVDCPAFTAPYV
jgi:hypothetical protein